MLKGHMRVVFVRHNEEVHRRVQILRMHQQVSCDPDQNQNQNKSIDLVRN
jgi:hypothetical protein